MLTQQAIDADETERKTIDNLITGVKEQRLLVEKAMPSAMDELNSAKVELIEATVVVEAAADEFQMLRTQLAEVSGQARRCEAELNERRTKQAEMQLLVHQHEESRLRLEGGIEALERYAPAERRAVPMQIEPLAPPTSSLNQ